MYRKTYYSTGIFAASVAVPTTNSNTIHLIGLVISSTELCKDESVSAQ